MWEKEIVDKLKNKHAKCFTIEQYNCWAHTLDMGKHDSYDHPPDLPFFVGRKKPTTSHSSAVVTNESDHPQSPGKRIRYCGECMEHNSKLFSKFLNRLNVMDAAVVHDENRIRAREWLHLWKEFTSQEVKKTITIHSPFSSSNASISEDDIAVIALYLTCHHELRCGGTLE